jgi:SPP1 gp7 family putative phage head morphogenesis protein
MIDLFTTPVPNEVAVEHLKALAPVTREQFDRLLPELRAQAFTVTGVEDANVLQRLRDIIAELPAGGSWDEAKAKVLAEISPWLANSEDPEERAKEEKAAERRAELLVRTHGFRAYAAATYRNLKANTDIMPWWKYTSFGDDRVRDTHEALNGVILAHDDPFWETHYPPWDWGCRCEVIGLTDTDVEEIRAAEAKKPPEERSTFEGRRLEELRNGRLVRGPGKNYDVRPPVDKAQNAVERATAWSFRPGEVKPDLDALRARYSPWVWREFEGFARQAKLPDGRSVWEWAGGKPGETDPGDGLSFAEMLDRAGIHPDDPETMTERNARALFKQLRRRDAVQVDAVVEGVVGADRSGNFTEANVLWAAREFLNMVPAEVARTLPKIRIQIVEATAASKAVLGGYSPETRMVTLVKTNLKTTAAMKATLMHELGHWVHLHGPKEYQELIRALFQARTAGEEAFFVAALQERVKRDRWFELYAGVERAGMEGFGVEVVSTHLATLASPVVFAKTAREHGRDFLDVLEVVARILTGERA